MSFAFSLSCEQVVSELGVAFDLLTHFRVVFPCVFFSAFSDFVDVYIASMGGIAKEPQNLEAKAKLRIDVWELLKSSDGKYFEYDIPCRAGAMRLQQFVALKKNEK